MQGKQSVFYINERKASASAELSCLLKKCIEKTDRVWEEIIILCIGSDRITGDSLGPLIGQNQKEASLLASDRGGCLSGFKKTCGIYHGGLRRALSRRRGTQGPPQRGGYFHHRDFERIRYL